MVIVLKEQRLMIGYKGFKQGMTSWGGKKYAENTVFTEKVAEVCKEGIHFCKRPLHVWEYYPPCERNGVLNEFAEVETCGEEVVNDDGQKYCTTKLKIKEKICMTSYLRLCLKNLEAGECVVRPEGHNKVAVNSHKDGIVMGGGDLMGITLVNTASFSAALGRGSRCLVANKADCSIAKSESFGTQSVVVNQGDGSAAVAHEAYSVVANTGTRSFVKDIGRNSVIANVGADSVVNIGGDNSLAANVASRAVVESDSKNALLVTNGADSAIVSRGNNSTAVCRGSGSSASVYGHNNIAIATGPYNNKVRGALGCWLVCAEYSDNSRDIIGIKSVCVDGEKIKPDVFYELKNGEFTEVS